MKLKKNATEKRMYGFFTKIEDDKVFNLIRIWKDYVEKTQKEVMFIEIDNNKIIHVYKAKDQPMKLKTNFRNKLYYKGSYKKMTQEHSSQKALWRTKRKEHLIIVISENLIIYTER